MPFREMIGVLLDFEAMPGRYPMAAREPRILFDHIHDVLMLAANRHVDGLALDPALSVKVRQAARFFVRTAMLRAGCDHYTLLGLAPGFDAATLRDHYRLMIRMTHPDFLGAAGAWPLDAAARINQANDVLSSPMRKREYDQFLSKARLTGSSGPLLRPASVKRAHRSVTAQSVSGLRKVLVASAWRDGVPGRRGVAFPLAVVVGAAILVMGWNSGGDEAVVAGVPMAGPLAREDTAKKSGAVAGDTMTAPVVATPKMSATSVRLPASGSEVAVETPTRATQSPLSSVQAVASRVAAAAPPAPISVVTAASPAPVAVPIQVPALPPAVAAMAMSVQAGVPSTVVAGPSAVSVSLPIAPVLPSSAITRINMVDVQPALANVINSLQSGRGEEVLQWVDRSAWRGDAAAGFVQAYNRILTGSRIVRLGQIQFRSRSAVDQLVVDGVIQLHLQDESLRTTIKDFHLRAYFASRDSGPVLTQLVASSAE